MSYSSTLKVEVALFTETSIDLYHSVRCHISEDSGTYSYTIRNSYRTQSNSDFVVVTMMALWLIIPVILCHKHVYIKCGGGARGGEDG
jgi:hypothetical protein